MCCARGASDTVRGQHPLLPQRPPVLHIPVTLRHHRRHQGQQHSYEPTTQRVPGGGFPFLWSPPPAAPAAFGGQGLVGVYYWYHRGMGAYFDDVCQYQEMSKVCIAAASPSSTSSEDSGGAGAGGVN